jgi:hypothetical protein
VSLQAFAAGTIPSSVKEGDNVSELLLVRSAYVRPHRPFPPKYLWLPAFKQTLESMPTPQFTDPFPFGELPKVIFVAILKYCNLVVAGRLGLTQRDKMSSLNGVDSCELLSSTAQTSLFRFYLVSQDCFAVGSFISRFPR